MYLDRVAKKARSIRNSGQYQMWRDKVMDRDKAACVLCGSEKEVEVDHIKPFALYPDLALKVDNGRVLCKKCHKKTDTFGSRSVYKGDEPIHPLLAGELLYKVNSLPSVIHLWGKDRGLVIKYHVYKKLWTAGYPGPRNITTTGKSVEEAINNIFQALRDSATYKANIELIEQNNKLSDKQMKHLTEKFLRKELYAYITSLAGRPLIPDEMQKIKKLFMDSVRACARKYNEENKI